MVDSPDISEAINPPSFEESKHAVSNRLTPIHTSSNFTNS